MNKEELEKTMCLDEDSKNEIEEKQDIYEEYDNLFREKKYSDIQESLDAMDLELADATVDENGDIIEEEVIEENIEDTKEVFEGFESTVLSHELDHLDGILHMDVAEELINASSEERKKWRQEHGYKIYYGLGDYDKLKKQEKGKNMVIKK